MHELLAEHIGSIIVVLFLAIMKAIEKLKKKRITSPANLATSNEFNMRIYSVLWPMLTRYRAIRILIYQFHNGDFFYSGHHIQRVTCSHEVQHDGIPQVKEMIQGVMVPESLHYILSICRYQDYFYIPDINDPELDKKLKEKLSVYKVKSAIYLPIKNKDGDVIALEILHYNHTHPLNEGEIRDLLFRMNRMQTIFNMRKKELA